MKLTKEQIINLKRRGIITKIVNPEVLVGKTVEDLRLGGWITHSFDISILEVSERESDDAETVVSPVIEIEDPETEAVEDEPEAENETEIVVEEE